MTTTINNKVTLNELEDILRQTFGSSTTAGREIEAEWNGLTIQVNADGDSSSDDWYAAIYPSNAWDLAEDPEPEGAVAQVGRPITEFVKGLIRACEELT